MSDAVQNHAPEVEEELVQAYELPEEDLKFEKFVDSPYGTYAKFKKPIKLNPEDVPSVVDDLLHQRDIIGPTNDVKDVGMFFLFLLSKPNERCRLNQNF